MFCVLPMSASGGVGVEPEEGGQALLGDTAPVLPEFRSYVILVGMKRSLTCVNAGVVVLRVVPTGLLRGVSRLW